MFNPDVEFAMFMLAFLSSFFRWAFPMGQCYSLLDLWGER